MEIFAACLIAFKKDKILSVSRKDNHSDWGLPGGKVDSGENPYQTIRRELFEETGLSVKNLKLELVKPSPHKGGYKQCAVFTGDVCGTIKHYEPHVVDWLDKIYVESGSFGQFNSECFKLIEAFKLLNIDNSMKNYYENGDYNKLLALLELRVITNPTIDDYDLFANKFL